ncbi:MAG TPA: ABC-F family ATP-binding cassette domain-containing protein [Chlamydiales bacterium]|nr:ABC-F family ATP-binding cassette domain-containing protein [Chlamydiales bacterium]
MLPFPLMITLENISKRVGNRTLFEDVTFTFNDRCRYGLTGPNGSGKSTLLKIVMGVEPQTSGIVTLPKKVGFLKQRIEDFRDCTVIDTVIMGNVRLWNAMTERDRLYEEEMTDAIGMRLGELEEVIADEEGYSAESEAEVILTGMGIPEELHRKKMHEIPSDKQFRALLCQALFGNPQALLLDEPTNHLDLESISWLEGFLHNYNGTLVVVSHDRHFLNSICTHIADIDYETIITYPGNYDAMFETKMAVRSRAEDENKAKEKKISQLKEFVAKFGAGTRASQVQSRIREIDRLQPLDLKKSNIQRPYIRFAVPEKQSGQVVVKVDSLSKAYDAPVIRDFTFEIHRGERIAVIGNNGRGKTTLLKLLAGLLTPDSGKVTLGHSVEVGYCPQNHGEVLQKHSKQTAFDWLKARKEVVFDQDARGILGKMLFGGDDAFKPLHNLSGGESARLIIGGLMLTAPNFLILDEPNNHLDLEAVSALAWGLQDFKGTSIVATHDRELINGFATKIIAFEEDGIHIHTGPLEEYLEKKKKLAAK